MREIRGVLFVCLTSHSLFAFELRLLLGARPSKRKSGDSNSLKAERRHKKAKVKSTIPPGIQAIELDHPVPTSPIVTTAPNPPSTTATQRASSPPLESSTSAAVSDSTSHISHTTAISSSDSRPPSASELSEFRVLFRERGINVDLLAGDFWWTTV
jgi:hypothetical protein